MQYHDFDFGFDTLCGEFFSLSGDTAPFENQSGREIHSFSFCAILQASGCEFYLEGPRADEFRRTQGSLYALAGFAR